MLWQFLFLARRSFSGSVWGEANHAKPFRLSIVINVNKIWRKVRSISATSKLQQIRTDGWQLIPPTLRLIPFTRKISLYCKSINTLVDLSSSKEIRSRVCEKWGGGDEPLNSIVSSTALENHSSTSFLITLLICNVISTVAQLRCL